MCLTQDSRDVSVRSGNLQTRINISQDHVCMIHFCSDLIDSEVSDGIENDEVCETCGLPDP